jgi:membrane associated rhomboid family serine protease
MFRLTPIVSNLIIVNVVVFILQSIIPGVTELLSLYNVHTELFRPYQLFTYMFCHANFMHILFNMLMFSFCGPILEDFWGQKRFFFFYVIAGIGAGIFNILMDLFFGVGAFDVMIGASGAIYGVMTAFGILFPNMELRFFLIPFSVKAKHLVMVLGAFAIFSGFRSSAGNTAHLAHLGGIVVAIILIQFWRSTGRE